MKVISLNKPIWVIGDVHGEYQQLLDLLNKIPQNSNICFVGDLIDRGYKSKEVVKLIRDNNYFIVKGNHEVLMIEAIHHNNIPLWIRNGGIETISSYVDIQKSIYEKGFYQNKEFNKLLENREMVDDSNWMNTLPNIIKFELDNEKPLYVSHSGIRLDLNDDLIDNFNPEHQVLWNRFKQVEVDYAVNIHGHTITSKEYSNISKSQINIDSGAFMDNMYRKSGKAVLTAICYPTMEKLYSI